MGHFPHPNNIPHAYLLSPSCPPQATPILPSVSIGLFFPGHPYEWSGLLYLAFFTESKVSEIQPCLCLQPQTILFDS